MIGVGQAPGCVSDGEFTPWMTTPLPSLGVPILVGLLIPFQFKYSFHVLNSDKRVYFTDIIYETDSFIPEAYKKRKEKRDKKL